METLKLMSTLAVDYFDVERYEDSVNIVSDKMHTVSESYDKNNLTVPAQTFLETADIFFATNDTQSGEELLKVALKGALKCFENGDILTSFQLYQELNEVAEEYLPNDNKILLEVKFGLVYMNYYMGNIPQSIEIYKKNISKFKKVFGEQDRRTLYAAKFLTDDYLALGMYDEARKIAEEKLDFCKKNFGDNDARTAEFTLSLANIYYRIGKYKTADKLLADLEKKHLNLTKSDTNFYFRFMLSKIIGTRLKGAYHDSSNLLMTICFKSLYINTVL